MEQPLRLGHQRTQPQPRDCQPVFQQLERAGIPLAIDFVDQNADPGYGFGREAQLLQRLTKELTGREPGPQARPSGGTRHRGRRLQRGFGKTLRRRGRGGENRQRQQHFLQAYPAVIVGRQQHRPPGGVRGLEQAGQGLDAFGRPALQDLFVPAQVVVGRVDHRRHHPSLHPQDLPAHLLGQPGPVFGP